jgi:hypothetical protein
VRPGKRIVVRVVRLSLVTHVLLVYHLQQILLKKIPVPVFFKFEKKNRKKERKPSKQIKVVCGHFVY